MSFAIRLIEAQILFHYILGGPGQEAPFFSPGEVGEGRGGSEWGRIIMPHSAGQIQGENRGTGFQP